ncbi:hypothetical protein [Catenulispora rubra]|uniref:hypothetical protein n=1 Tax=Catenulispora rubra TaxID=280293 RepID=UPI001892648F|nr:hypothetical protein [Catenulispora rubra]
MTGDYTAPEPPVFERAGALVIRSLAECVLCEARSGWWFGAVSTTWTAAHTRDAHPNQTNVGFRLWRIVRHSCLVTPEGLAHTPDPGPEPDPVCFALSECCACGAATGWLTADEAGGPHGLQEFEQHHLRTAHHETPPDFDRWHLTRQARARIATTRRPTASI